ncbi:MAG: DUF2075 domain-containing protein [Alphaproteobacteria bacterium]|nr:DUF2075 domain-containing protein [Alphaproteobacteria bacterium]
MRLPTYDEISRDEEQLNVYETPFDESLFVVGPPGSGKTVLAVHRAQMLANADDTVVLITYNHAPSSHSTVDGEAGAGTNHA